jgi:hypothetical protein
MNRNRELGARENKDSAYFTQTEEESASSEAPAAEN